MNRQTKIVWVGGIIAFMVLVIWLFTGGEQERPNSDQRERFVSANWTKRFQLYDRNPLGLYLFTTLTQTHISLKHRLVEIPDWVAFDSLVNDNPERRTYMFVGNNFGLQNAEIDTLLAHVYDGSDLFLSFNDLTENLYERLLDGITFEFDYAPSINVFTDQHKYTMLNLFQTDTVACEWRAFGSISPSIPYQTRSSFMEMPNFIKIELGDGNVFLHSTPTAFYNYQIKRLHGYRYAEYVLNEFPNNRDVYLLELGRLTDNYGNFDVDEQDGPGEKEDDSYLRLIFENPPLLIALLLSILGLILFVIFRSKRTRPIVPFIARKKDMTLAFAETITSIYFAKRNPYGLLQVQRKNFYATVNKHFFVDLQRREGDRALQILAEKSNRRFEEIRDLLARLETKEASSVSDQYVTEMQKRLHAFYRTAGIISSDLSEKLFTRDVEYKRSLVVPAALILGGIYVFIQGTYLLVASVGIGIALWPLSFALLFLGIKRITNPYLTVSSEEIVFYTSLGQKRKFKREDLISTDLRKGGVVFNFRNNKQLIINYWDMSTFDRKQFKQFLSKLNNLEL